MTGLHPNQPASVRISAVRAVFGFCEHLKNTGTTQLLFNFLPNIMEGLLTITTQFSSNVLALTLETLILVLAVSTLLFSLCCLNWILSGVKACFFLSLFFMTYGNPWSLFSRSLRLTGRKKEFLQTGNLAQMLAIDWTLIVPLPPQNMNSPSTVSVCRISIKALLILKLL